VSDKKIIAVVGATGAQGGGLVRAIVEDKSGPFVARAITRNAGSEKAKEQRLRRWTQIQCGAGRSGAGCNEQRTSG